ncbi:hypothetical protein GALL_41180 [mine drainage metagenome]|uniref:Uncharacterized protein n=1 Tax=mine drainage metagenome TaxID=410659 RepID=A0A1J5TFP7_9ZZZZ
MLLIAAKLEEFKKRARCLEGGAGRCRIRAEPEGFRLEGRRFMAILRPGNGFCRPGPPGKPPDAVELMTPTFI